jgi:hypothetical protein
MRVEKGAVVQRDEQRGDRDRLLAHRAARQATIAIPCHPRIAAYSVSSRKQAIIDSVRCDR